MLAEHVDFWARTQPGTAGVLVVATLLVLGIVLAYRLLHARPEAPEPAPPLDELLEQEVRALARARERLAGELSRTDGPLRAALGSLIEGPLREVDRRAGELILAARACSAWRAAPDPRLDAERSRIQAQLEHEDDARARALLSASLRDLDAARRVRGDLEHTARLVRLELGRLRALLESLPARVQELAARQLVHRADAADVEAIARQIEMVVESTSEVLDEIVPERADAGRARRSQ
jgi:hypothetical protein